MAAKRKDELLKLTKTDLLLMAKDLKLSGFTQLNKDPLVDLIITAEKKASAIASKAEHEKPSRVREKPAPKAAKSPKEPVAKSDKLKADSASAKPRARAKPKSQNGLAIQHPSASPTALRYGRLAEADGRAEAPAHPPAIWPDRNSIPTKYGRDRLVTFVRDPLHLFCIWEISDERLAELSQSIDGELWMGRRMVLRVFRETGGMPRIVSTIDIFGEVGRFHIEVPESGQRYFIEIGFFLPNGRYETVLTDRLIKTPQVRPPRVGPVRWIHVKARETHRVTSLETQTVPHPSGESRIIRKSVYDVVDERRRDFGIEDSPSHASPDKARGMRPHNSTAFPPDFKSGDD